MEVMIFEKGEWRIESCDPPKTKDYSKLVTVAQRILIDRFSGIEKEQFDERAAIIECDGGLSREVAEKMSLRLILSARFKN
ncbi:MAG: hypothetical protein ACRBF0_11690 [Calditrichia bacterium]